MKKSHFITLILSAAFALMQVTSMSQALDPPVLTCVQATAAGEVVVQWEAPDDPNGEFTSYNIYYADDPTAPVWNLETSIANYGTLTYLHATANSDTTPACYYITTSSNDGSPQESGPSDILCVPFLTIDDPAPPGVVELVWGNPYALSSPPSGSDVEIWLQYPVGTYTLVDVVDINTYTYEYEVNICSALYEFQIRVNTPYGCQILSNLPSDVFVDGSSPDVPNVTYVTVDPLTQNAVVNWDMTEATDTYGYIIYTCDFGFPVPVDTVYNWDSTELEILTSNAGVFGSESYVVAAFDSCITSGSFDNLSPTSTECHSTIFLEPIFPISCENYVNLEWNHYEGWADGIDSYEILVSADGGPFIVAGTVDGATNTFTATGLDINVPYTFLVRSHAVTGGYISESNYQVINLLQGLSPSFANLFAATVEGRNEVLIAMLTEVVPDNHTYVLERLDYNDEDFKELTSVSTNQQFLDFYDYDVDTQYESFRYRIVVLNNCGDTVVISNEGKPMLLQGFANNTALVNTLTWSPYQEWESGPDSYNIYRSENPGELGQLIGTAPGSVNYYEDNEMVNNLLTPGEFCYTIEALKDGILSLPTISCWSNQACLQMEPKIWIPNAFVVNGFNNIFKPVIRFAEPSSFRMIIYSRWGDVVYDGNDIEEGWDGNYKGSLVPEGQYAYYISVQDGQGRLHERKGTLIMLVGSTE